MMNLRDSKVFAALGDPVRMQIVEQLSRAGELSAGAIAGEHRISAPAISRHLKLLEQARLVQSRQQHRWRYYSINRSRFEQARSWFEQQLEFWENSLERLDAALKRECNDHQENSTTLQQPVTNRMKARKMIDNNLPHPIPNETPQYREARNALLQLEAELRQKVTEVAVARAALPDGGKVGQDYVFTTIQDGQSTDKPMSALFGEHSSLLIYSYMYGPDDEAPCPMCTSFLDSLNGGARHIKQRTGLAVVTSAPIETAAAIAHQRGWSELPMISCAGNSYNRDYFGETDDGAQMPICNVFNKSGNDIRHFWSSELFFAKLEGHPRHIDMLWPLWNVFDVLPHGRGTDWFPALDYGDNS